MSDLNPFGDFRATPVDPDHDLAGQLPVIDLVQRAVNGTVESGAASWGLELFSELDRRGGSAWWQAADLCLQFLASNPVQGRTGSAAAAELRRAASAVTDPVTRLTMELLADQRADDADASRRRWSSARAELRAAAGRRLFVMVCGAADSGPAHLTRSQAAELAEQLLG